MDSEKLALVVMCTLLGLLCGAFAGCMTMACMVLAVQHDNMPLFYGLVAAGGCTGLLVHTGPLVASYARTALGRK